MEEAKLFLILKSVKPSLSPMKFAGATNPFASTKKIKNKTKSLLLGGIKSSFGESDSDKHTRSEESQPRHVSPSFQPQISANNLKNFLSGSCVRYPKTNFSVKPSSSSQSWIKTVCPEREIF